MNEADAIVVGSGAAGGWAAKELTEAGLSVLMLEAGPQERRAPSVGRSWAQRVWRHARRKQPVQEMHPIYWNKNPDLFVSDTEQPYGTPTDRPFMWIRGRQLGGRTLLWGGVTLRLSDYELKAAERDGYGPSWPLSYCELAPFYDRVERFLGIHGTKEGLRQLPDGCFIGSRPLTRAERHLSCGVAAAWPDRRIIPSRGLAITQHGGISSPLSSVSSTIATAYATGRLRILTGCVASHLIPNRRTGGAAGVAFVDAETGDACFERAQLIVLCASTIETVRILLTTQKEHPELPVSESDCIGRYLMDHVLTGTVVEMDGIAYESPAPRTGADSFLLPRYQNLAVAEPYLRGYGLWGGIQRKGFAGRRGRPARGFVVAQGEMLPRACNRVILGEKRCANGLRNIHIDCSWGENDRAIHADMMSSVGDMMQAGGGHTKTLFDSVAFLPGLLGLPGRLERFWISPAPGSFAHEVGGARMGSDPVDSVVDSRNRCWGMPNVLITDGACWPTSGWQGPTLTIMALTARACMMAVADLRRKELGSTDTKRRAKYR